MFRASLHAFQQSKEAVDEAFVDEPELHRSNVLTYLGIDKREGLVSMGKRLLKGIFFLSVSLILCSYAFRREIGWSKHFVAEIISRRR